MARKKFGFAKLPGTGNIKWPVQLIKYQEKEDYCTIYCKSDHAQFVVKNEWFSPFEDCDVEKLKTSAFHYLKKKKATLECFVNDLQWVTGCNKKGKGKKRKNVCNDDNRTGLPAKVPTTGDADLQSTIVGVDLVNTVESPVLDGDIAKDNRTSGYNKKGKGKKRKNVCNDDNRTGLPAKVPTTGDADLQSTTVGVDLVNTVESPVLDGDIAKDNRTSGYNKKGKGKKRKNVCNDDNRTGLPAKVPTTGDADLQSTTVGVDLVNTVESPVLDGDIAKDNRTSGYNKKGKGKKRKNVCNDDNRTGLPAKVPTTGDADLQSTTVGVDLVNTVESPVLDGDIAKDNRSEFVTSDKTTEDDGCMKTYSDADFDDDLVDKDCVPEPESYDIQINEIILQQSRVTELVDKPKERKVSEAVDEPQQSRLSDAVDEPQQGKILNAVDYPEQRKVSDAVDEPQQSKVSEEVEEPEQRKGLDLLNEPQQSKVSELYEPEQRKGSDSLNEAKQSRVPKAIDEPQQRNITDLLDEPQQIKVSDAVDEPQLSRVSEAVDEPEQKTASASLNESQQSRVTDPVDEPEQREVSEAAVDMQVTTVNLPDLGGDMAKNNRSEFVTSDKTTEDDGRIETYSDSDFDDDLVDKDYVPETEESDDYSSDESEIFSIPDASSWCVSVKKVIDEVVDQVIDDSNDMEESYDIQINEPEPQQNKVSEADDEPQQSKVADSLIEPQQSKVSDAVDEPQQNRVTDAVDEPEQRKVTEAADKPLSFTINDKPEQRTLEPSDCIYDEKHPKIYIKKFQMGNINSKHGRVYDRVFACLYCHKLVTNITTHLQNKHRDKEEVKEIMRLQKSKKKDKENKELQNQCNKKLSLIRNMGNSLHNHKVVKFDEGELLVSRRLKDTKFKLKDYGPCPHCSEWIVINTSITNHQKSCPAAPSTDSYHKGSSILTSSVLSGKITLKGSKILQKEVLPNMKRDSIYEIVVKDSLIIGLGDVWILKNIDNKRKRKHYASFHMRLVARLMQEIRKKKENEEMSFLDAIKPVNFDDFVECSLNVANSTENEELKHPSTPVKLGFDISRLAALKLAQSIKTSDTVAREEATNFMQLLKMEWSTRVNRISRAVLQERNFNKRKPLPHPEDIAKLANYLVKELQKVELDPAQADTAQFRNISILVQSRLLLYNRRRPGELEALSLQYYRNRSSHLDETDMSLRHQLSDLEKKMLESQELIEIRGKNGTRVPVIIPEEAVLPMAFLANNVTRKNAGIKDENPFLFANTALDVVKAANSLEEVRSRCELKLPERIHATNLRKHCATIAQVIGLKDHEMKWLCRHLGHTRKVHDAHYKATSGLIERLDIAKLMLIQEGNMQGKFVGKSLTDINFSEVLSEEQEDSEPVEKENTFESEEEAFESFVKDDGDDDLISEKKTKNTRVKWTKEEEEEIKKYFQRYFSLEIKKTCPSRTDCMAALKKSKDNDGHICTRNWETLKKKVRNMLLKN